MSKRAWVAVLVALIAGGGIGALITPDRTTPSAAGRTPPTVAEPPTTPPEWMRGTGRLAILVETQGGEPVPGVLVRASPETRRRPARDSSGRPPPDHPIQDLIRELTANTLRERRERFETRTGADGTAVLEGMADIEWQISAWREGYLIEPRHPVRFRRPGGEERFEARPLVPVPVTILLPDGTEPESARLKLVGPGIDLDLGWSPSQRTVWIPPGERKFDVTSGPHRTFIRKLVRVSVRPDESPAPLTIRLAARRGIRGRVVGLPTDLGFPGKLRILRLTEGEGEDTPRILEHRECHEVRAYGTMDFQVDWIARSEMAPGRWLLGLIEEDEILATTVVEVTEGIAECEIVVPEPDPKDYVIVSLLGRSENLNRLARVFSRIQVGKEKWHGPYGERLRDGRHRVRHARPKGEVGEGTPQYSLIIDSRKIDDQVIPYGGPEDDEVEVTVSGPETLNVQLIGYRDTPHVGSVMITLRPLEPGMFDPPWFTHRPPDREGNWFQERISRGDYELLVTSSCGFPIHREILTIESGENQAEVRLPPLHTLDIHCDDPAYQFKLGSAMLEDHRAGTRYRRLQRGKVVFEHLPAGEYVIRANRPGEGHRMGRVIVRVPDTSEFHFNPNPTRGLTVRKTDPRGTLARAYLCDGDLIVAVDGREITTLDEFLKVSAASTHKFGLLLCVRTRGAWEETRVRLGAPEEWGGTLEETR